MSAPLVISLLPGADPEPVRRALVERGLWIERLDDGERVCFAVAEHSTRVETSELRRIAGVQAVAERRSPHPRVDAQGPRVEIAGVPIGGVSPKILLAGPCSVESAAQIDELAARVRAAGGRFLRGGAWKPRTSPYSFQGHGPDALAWLRRAADAHGLAVVTEATSTDEVRAVAEVAELIQIGSRNMQNFALLRAAGRTGRAALLKRGISATVEEWLLAGEYLLHHGASAVVFCERGVRGFDPTTRNLLDLGAVALLAHVVGAPVIADPSHAAGRRDLVRPLARAALSAGAAGVLIETHADPGRALSDGPQALAPDALRGILDDTATREAA